MGVEAGLAASFDHVVISEDTAIAFGSGDVPVLATPRILALVERATVQAVSPEISDDLTTVGVRAELDHRLPTAVGATVRVDAVLESVAGRRLTFGVRITDGDRTVADGLVVRAVVTRERFLRLLDT